MKILRIFGIPVYLHPTWFIVFVLVSYGLWAYLEREYPGLNANFRALAAGMTALLFFASILLHELGHSVVALRHKVAVRSITLFIFGGVALMEREPDSPAAEFRIAIAGPITSALLGLLFAALAELFSDGSMGAVLFGQLAFVNVAVALFNLLPGFPMDGGRILRALLWMRSGDATTATRAAASAGQTLAYAMIGVGAFIALSSSLQGLWLAFIGWFVLTAAGATQRQASLALSLRGLVARDVMSRHVERVSRGMPVGQFAREFVMRGQRWAVVEEHEQAVGLVTLSDVQGVPAEEWDHTPVGQVSTAIDQVVSAPPETEVNELLQILGQHGMAQIPIMEAGRIVGAVTRQNLVQAIQLRGGEA